jgi:hypothetical protein
MEMKARRKAITKGKLTFLLGKIMTFLLLRESIRFSIVRKN